MRYLLPILALFLVFASSSPGADELRQSPLKSPQERVLGYPRVVLFSTSWCPHCKRAKAYFTENNIPFINRDVELDSEAMQLLTGRYQSQSVPLIVIGNDEAILRGFDETRFEQAVEKLRKK